MSHPDVAPPDIDTGDGDDGGGHHHVEMEINVYTQDGEQTVGAAWPVYGGADPTRFAEELLGLARAIACMRGDDYTWALVQRLNAVRP